MAIRNMKNGKATGPDDLPVEVWKSLGRTSEFSEGSIEQDH